MKSLLRICLLFFISFSFAQKQSSSVGFIENKGQIVDQNGNTNSGVKYLLNTNGLNVQLRKNGFSYDIYEPEKKSKANNSKDKNTSYLKNEAGKIDDNAVKYNYHRIDIDFVNSNASVELIPHEKTDGYDNYYNVSNTPNGILEVAKFKKVIYENIYNHIDVIFFVPEDIKKPVEYNFLIRPGGQISDIQLKLNGCQTDLIDNKIRLKTRFGIMEETLPMSWVENGTGKNEVVINYKKINKNIYSFESSENLEGKKIIIDPTPNRLWGTYYNDGYISSITTDNLDNLYFCGTTSISTNIATLGSFQPNLFQYNDAFIVKFDSNGNRIWGTYYGGNNNDSFNSINIFNNELILGGTTRSSNNIATPGSFKSYLTPGGFMVSDAFIVKFNLNGQRIWGTYYGGEHDDTSSKTVVDANGNIIIVGETYSVNGIATPGTFKDYKTVPFNPNATGEGYITKFNNAGFQIWGSYYNLCEIWGLDVDSLTNIYFSGDVGSNNYIATPGTHQPTFLYNTTTAAYQYDSFLVKFTPNGQRAWGTHYGFGWEYNHCVKVDHNDNVYISGYTTSGTHISTPGAFQVNLTLGSSSNQDAYLAKFDPNGQIIWGTYYGGDSFETIATYTLDFDENNNVFFAGSTPSSNFISTAGSLDENLNGGTDVFIAKFSPLGSRIWATYFGGSGTDYSNYIHYHGNGIFYIAGYTYSNDIIATTSAHQSTINSSKNLFIEKFKDCLSVATTSSNSPICVGTTLQLTSSGGTNYTWTGPNSFSSNQQNPVILNATIANSGSYTCAITGTGGCDVTNTITIVIGDTQAPLPNLPTLPNSVGDCNTVVTAPTAIDNCAGTITATTTDPLNYPLPGTYTVHWNYSDGNGNISTQNQTVIVNAVALPTITSPQSFCIQQNATLNSILITGQNIKWYDAQTAGNLLNNSTLLVNGTTYYASQTINNCESLRVPIAVNIQNTQSPTGANAQSFCSTQNATLNDIAITGANINWYSAATSTTILPSSTVLTNGTYYATQTQNNCESVNRLTVTVTLINTLNAIDFSVEFCDDLNDNSETANLTSYNSNLILNPLNCTFNYYNSFSGANNQTISDEIINPTNLILNQGVKIIYVRITSNNGCSQVVKLTLTVFQKPIISIRDSEPICENSSIIINAGNGFDSYSWSTGQTSQSISISQAGNYNVTLTDNHSLINCSSTKNFTVVLSNKATIKSIETLDWTDTANSIEINVNGLGDYEYSIDGNHYQDSPVFEGLLSGSYMVYVRDKNGCGIVQDDVFLLMYPKFFTPNNDAINDTWKIKFSQNEPNLKVKIYDRYGKLMKTMDNKLSWDGNYMGSQVLSDDYWFVVTRANGKEHRGHFTLKR